MLKVPQQARRVCSARAARHAPPAAQAVCILVLAALGCLSCGPRAELTQVRADRPLDALVSAGRPTALLFWAPLRRDHLQFLDAFDRLAEQRGKAAAMAAVCIVEAEEDLAALDPRAAAAHVEHYVWKQPLSNALDAIGASGLPALLAFDDRGRLLHRLAAADRRGGFDIPDMTDAIDAATQPGAPRKQGLP